jgi:hypothetical protein
VIRDTRTHHVPSFTRRLPDGREETICGAFVAADQIAPTETRPTCWGCAAWLNSPFASSSAPVPLTDRSPAGEIAC